MNRLFIGLLLLTTLLISSCNSPAPDKPAETISNSESENKNPSYNNIIRVDTPYSDLGLMVSKDITNLDDINRSLDNRVLKSSSVKHKVLTISTSNNSAFFYESPDLLEIVIEAPFMRREGVEFTDMINEAKEYIETNNLQSVAFTFDILEDNGTSYRSITIERYILPKDEIALEFNNGWTMPVTDILILN